MRVSHIRLAVLAAVSGLALGGCAYGYDGYGGYGGLNVGYGYSNYGYGGYGYDPYGYGYGYGYGSPYGYGDYGYSPFGWYDGFYYPGTGIYVYDSYRRRHTWNDSQQRYWRDRVNRWNDRTRTTRSTTTVRTVSPRENWTGFNRVRTRSSETARSSNDDSTRSRHWGRSSSSSSSRSDDTRSTRSSDWRERVHRSKND